VDLDVEFTSNSASNLVKRSANRVMLMKGNEIEDDFGVVVRDFENEVY